MRVSKPPSRRSGEDVQQLSLPLEGEGWDGVGNPHRRSGAGRNPGSPTEEANVNLFPLLRGKIEMGVNNRPRHGGPAVDAKAPYAYNLMVGFKRAASSVCRSARSSRHGPVV